MADAATPSISRDNKNISKKAVAVKDAVGDLAGEAATYAQHRVSGAKETAMEWAETAKDKAVEYRDTAEEYVQRNPYRAIAIAAGIGFVVGLLLKRR